MKSMELNFVICFIFFLSSVLKAAFGLHPSVDLPLIRKWIWHMRHINRNHENEWNLIDLRIIDSHSTRRMSRAKKKSWKQIKSTRIDFFEWQTQEITSAFYSIGLYCNIHSHCSPLSCYVQFDSSLFTFAYD